jgi:predicted ATPase with chaperone activity
MLVKVNNSTFVRDTNSMALIDTDMASKNEYLAKVRMLQTQKEEINKVKSEIADVKGDLQVIKQLMTQLLSKGSNV